MKEAIDIVVVVLIVGLILWRRIQATRRPIKNGFSLVIPLIYIVVIIGIAWKFLTPHVQYPPAWAILVTAVIGILVSLPLIFTTNYDLRSDGNIYTRRNRMFIFTFVGLIVVRVLGTMLLQHVDPTTSTFLMYVLLISYFVPWRVACLVKYQRVAAQGTRPAVM